MNILKKFLATIITIGVLFQVGSTYAEDIVVERIGNEAEIMLTVTLVESKIKGGEEIIAKINTFMSTISSEKNQKLKNKISIIKNKISSQTNQAGGKQEKILLLIRYIELKIQEKELNETPQASLKPDYSEILSDEENKKINTELVKIQKNILNHGTTYIEKIIGEFEKYANYQEKGNFKANIDIDHELVGKIKAELKLNDYEINNSNFDAQLKTKMKTIIDAAPNGSDAMKLEMSSLIDLIIKDQNYFLLLKELNIVDESGIEDMEEMMQVMKDIAATNKYIHFKDVDGAQAMNILKNFSPKNILSQGNDIVSKPLFKAYKKVGERYYLLPTKYACDTAKKLAQKFDPFNGDTCTQGQYEDMLEDIADSKIELYIELGQKTTIGFDASMTNSNIEEFNGSIVFSSSQIEELNFIIKPDQNIYLNEGAKLEYKKDAYLNGYIYAKSGKIDVELTSTLDKNNAFKSGEMNLKIDELMGNISLLKKKIHGKYSAISSTQELRGSISGKIDNVGKIEQLKISNSLINKESYDPFVNTSRFEYNKGQIVFTNDYKSEGTKLKFDVGASWNPSKKELVSGNFSIDVETKESSYDYKTYKRVYNGDFEKVFECEITLQNKGISGETIARKNGKILMRIDHSGQYAKNYLQFNNEFSGELYQYLIGQEGEMSGNINIGFDQRSNKNNGNLFVEIYIDTDKVVELEVDNQSNRVYKNIDINTPSNTIELDEILTTPKY